ncbi:MAG: hypothetical protein QOJ25_655 [Solirubrobacteraceae bacterium]|nr:hypothetical protein [Solirubrobacteraceae bacterium]
MLTLIACLIPAAALPAFSRAGTGPGPGYLDVGFSDQFAFQYASGPIASTWYARAQSLGSSYVRLVASWRSLAPAKLRPGFQAASAADPRYSWSSLDSQVEGAVAHGQHVVLMIFGAPRWAQGGGAPSSAILGTWRPSPSALGAFARALAQRYSGSFPDPLHGGQSLPRVTYFQAWNEPNLPIDLGPQWTRGTSGQWIPASPGLYRRMLNAVYFNIKAVQPSDYVLAAGTAPYGDAPGVNRMAPVVFLRELLCLSGPRLRPESCPNPAHFDALDHHPYSLTPTLHAYSSENVSVPDLGRLTAILRVAERTGRALPAGPKPLWVTEIAWSSNPPDPLAIPDALQARYLALTFYQFWRQGVTHAFWLLIRDYPYKSLTGSGLYFQNGTAELSAQAFRFPFVALHTRRGILTLWGHAPGPGTVEIERGNRNGWQPVTSLTANPGGIFYAQLRLGSHQVLRARLGSVASLGWATN